MQIALNLNGEKVIVDAMPQYESKVKRLIEHIEEASSLLEELTEGKWKLLIETED